jgi:hypothetical protein
MLTGFSTEQSLFVSPLMSLLLKDAERNACVTVLAEHSCGAKNRNEKKHMSK